MGAGVVLVGLDGADGELVSAMADDGRLPVLAGLRARGAWGRLDSIVALGDDAAWCSLATGVGPGVHGRRYYRHYPRGSYAMKAVARSDILAPPFWDALAAHGRRVAVLDVPKAPVGTDARTLVVTDWMAHGGHLERVEVQPAERHAELSGYLDTDDDLWDCHDGGTPEAFRTRLCARAEVRADLAVALLEREHWDAVIVVFGETHCGGHFLWDQEGAVEHIYGAVDAQLGRIVAAAGRDATVLVFSPLGMAPNHSAVELADAVLARLDEGFTVHSSRPWRARVLDAAREQLPQALRRRIPEAVHRVAAHSRDREFGTRRFWRVPTDLPATPVRLNVVGREPHGKVAPTDVDAVCEELRREFLALTDPATGRRLVSDVLIARDAFPGDAPDDFADVHVLWDRRRPLDAASSPRVGEVRVRPDPWRPGEHRDPGWLVAVGPGFAPGSLAVPASVLDLAPTVARLLGVPFQGEGRVLPEAARAARGQAAVGSTANAAQSSE
ncbi:MAG TPA: alkaline phosphatase family protein [Acidimicrobiia bacterium]|nr:alkaline phosphatase family protein [Acidimicrobiia bacterium]